MPLRTFANIDNIFFKEFAYARGGRPLTAITAGLTDLSFLLVGVADSGTNNFVFSAGAGTPPITSTFDPATGLLSNIGDGLAITTSGDAAGTMPVNDGQAVQGDTPTVANAISMQLFGQGGDHTISLNEANAAPPAANLSGGSGNEPITGGDGIDTAEVGRGNGETFTIAANAFDRVDPAPSSPVIGTTENLLINTNSGGDTITAGNGLAALIKLTVVGGADTITGGDGANTPLGSDGNDSVVGAPANAVALLGVANQVSGDGSNTVKGQDGVGLASGVASASLRPAVGDEFVGPFPSWTNVKTVYGAKGDGVTDDTAALQAALNDVGLNGHSSILYLPAGTYKISSTLNLQSRDNISIIGEDPSTTTIKWAGASGGTELHIDGLDHSRFDRLTFDGAGVAGVLVDQSWSGGNYFDTGNQYADNVFKDAAIGIQGGALGGGFAETSVLRDHFSNLTTAGILTLNYNALDLWVWYSTFDHCYVGVGNCIFLPDGTTINGAGGFEVNDSVFRYSGQDDISIGNVASPYAVRNNYSIGSEQFINTAGNAASAPLSISGNTIIDTTNPRSLNLHNVGANVLYDNTIKSLPSVTSGPVVEGLNVVALGNTFTVPSAIQNQDWAWNPALAPYSRITEVDTTVASPSTISTAEPILPGVEPDLHRPIFEVPVGADAATIQQVINSAAAQNGNRPVVHIPEGIYHIASTITIPANTDIQLVGDGNTTLQWTGTGSGPILYLPGPTQATLRDFQLDGGYRPYDPHFAAGIVVDNIDQPGSHVYLEQVLSAGGAQTNFLANGLDYTVIEAHDFSHLYQSLPGSVGVKVVGGPLAAAGNPQTGSVNIYSGLSANEMLPWDVSGGGKLLVRDVWYEASPSPAFLHLTGSGTLTMEGLMVAYSLINQSTPTFDINNFKGNATFINDYTSGNWVVSGDGTQAHVLGVGLNEITPTSTYFSNDASPAATVGLLQSMNASPNADAIGGTAYPTPNTGTLDDAFLRDMFAQTRGAEPHLLTDLAAGVTDLRIFRVGVGNSGTDNIVFSAGTFDPATGGTVPPSVDVNQAPTITSDGGGSSAAISVAENTALVTTVTATDPDAGQNLSYSIIPGADGANFTIGVTTGVLTFVTAPDFENATDANRDNVYGLTVQVSDGRGGIDTQAIAVTVTNVGGLTIIASNEGGGQTLNGSGEDDVIIGGRGDDQLSGGNGNDIMIGGAGNDTMDGGPGNDAFIFSRGFGNDLIIGFDADPSGGQDVLDLVQFAIRSTSFSARVAITDVGADTLITIDGNPAQTIRLIGIGDATTVTVADFILGAVA